MNEASSVVPSAPVSAPVSARARRVIAGRARAYALSFVLMIAVALAVIVGGLFALLSEGISSSRQSQEEIQQLYGCDGALRLAIHEASRNGADSADIAKLQETLGVLSAALRTDINPRSKAPFADLEGIVVESQPAIVSEVTSDPFHGMQFVLEGSDFVVIANPDSSRGRTCRAQSPNRARTISYFQFAAVSNDILVSRPSGIGGVLQATAGTTGDVYTLEHSAGERKRLLERRTVTNRGPFTVQDIHISDQETFRPVPPSGQPWSFINKKKKFFGGTKRRTRHKRPAVEYFTKYPTNDPSIDPTNSRFAIQANLKILDGEWYVRDGFGGFPGNKVWSDRPAGRGVGGDLLYSAYETRDGRAQGGGAVVRYGLVKRTPAGGGPRGLLPMAKGFCADVDELAPVKPGATSTPAFHCSEGIVEAGVVAGVDVDPLLEAASQGFFDPYDNGSGPTPILPIVIDIAALGAAMVADAPGDLGAIQCLSDDDSRCPETRRFKGSLWVGTLPSGIQGNGTPNPSTRPGGGFPDGSKTLPCPLDSAGSTSCARPNAVVLTNMENLAVFHKSGLSVASNLPIYVIGNVNSDTPSTLRNSRVALLAPSITGLAPDFDMSTLAWSKGTSTTPAAASTTLEWNTSIFTAWTSPDLRFRDPGRHVLRRIQSGLGINVTGSMVAMFNRGDYDKVRVFNTKKGSFSDPRPDPLIFGVPVFFPDAANPEETGSRLAAGTLRFPGEDLRDLRRAKVREQPPASPRFSIDPAPIDRR